MKYLKQYTYNNNQYYAIPINDRIKFYNAAKILESKIEIIVGDKKFYV